MPNPYCPCVGRLEVNLPLHGNIRASNLVIDNRQLDVRGPRRVLPLHIHALVGPQRRREGVVISQIPLPLHRQLAGPKREAGGDAVLRVDLVGDRDLLLVLGGGDLNSGLAGVVVHGHVQVLGGDVLGAHACEPKGSKGVQCECHTHV